MNTISPRVLTHEGKLYFRYAGPFSGGREAVEAYAQELFSAGEIDESSKPICRYNSLYLLELP
jgi:hypothetical protein